HVECGHVLLDQRILLLGGQRPGPAALRLDAEDEVLADAEVADDALVAPVLARVGDAGGQGLCGRGDLGLRSLETYGAGFRLVRSVDEAGELGAAAAEQTGDAEHLSGVEGDVRGLEGALAAQALRAVHGGAAAVHLAAG